MDQSLIKKNDFKVNLTSFLKGNKLKIIFFFILLFIILLTLFAWSERKKKINILLSEKHIKASLFLSEGKMDQARILYEEIINNNDKFYSLLALNSILEKNLLNDKKLILGYFSKLENKNYPKETLDLIYLKKALYFIKIKENEKGKKILNQLINQDSNLKDVAQEIIK